VPVVQPRWVTLAEPALRWLGGAAAACALIWLGLPAGLAWPLALAAIVLGMPATIPAAISTTIPAFIRQAFPARQAFPTQQACAVRALLFTADQALYIRARQGWRPLSLRAATRGWRCLALQGDLPAPLSRRPSPRRVSFTIWQDALPAPAWRRLNLACQRRLRRVPGPVRGRRAAVPVTADAETGTA